MLFLSSLIHQGIGVRRFSSHIKENEICLREESANVIEPDTNSPSTKPEAPASFVKSQAHEQKSLLNQIDYYHSHLTL